MPKAFFKVSLNEIKARGLVPPDGKSADPYLKFNFGGDFRLLRTQYKSNELNPTWDFQNDFFYNTAFPEKLSMKYLVVECWDHRTFGSDLFVGQVAVDLFTLATGPVNHELSLKNEQKEVTGKVWFELEMTEQLKDFTFTFRDVSITGLTVQGSESLVSLDYCFSEDLTKALHSTKLLSSAPLRWESLPPLPMSTLVTTLIDEKATVQFKLFLHPGEPLLLGSVSLEVLQIYADDAPVTFKNAALLNANGQPSGIVLSGSVVAERGPRFAQMRGPPEVALHHDGGVTFSGSVLEGFPVPDRWKPAHKPETVDLKSASAAAAVTPAAAQDVAPPPAAAAPGGVAANMGAAASLTPTAVGQQPVMFQQINGHFVPVYAAAAGAGAAAAAATPALGPPPAFGQSSAPTTAKRTVSLKILTPEPRKKTAEDDLAPLPRHWSSKTDAKGQIYFRYSPTRQTTWLDPRFLPQGWEQRLTAAGEVYFARPSQRTTCWEDPRGMPPKWEAELDPKTHALVFVQSQMQTPVDPRGLPPGFMQAIDPNRGRLYYSNSMTKTTQWNDPRRDLSFDEQKRLMKAERAAWFAAKRAEVKRADDEQKEFDLGWNLRRDDLDEGFKRWVKLRAAEYAELQRFRDEDDAQAVARIDSALRVQQQRFDSEVKEIEDEHRRMAQIKIAEAQLRHFQERKKLDAELQSQRDKVKADRSAYNAEMEAKQAAEAAARNEQLKKEREALAQEEEVARGKKQSAKEAAAAASNPQSHTDVDLSTYKTVLAADVPAAAAAAGAGAMAPHIVTGGNTLPRGFMMPNGAVVMPSPTAAGTPLAFTPANAYMQPQQFSFAPVQPQPVLSPVHGAGGGGRGMAMAPVVANPFLQRPQSGTDRGSGVVMLDANGNPVFMSPGVRQL